MSIKNMQAGTEYEWWITKIISTKQFDYNPLSFHAGTFWPLCPHRRSGRARPPYDVPADAFSHFPPEALLPSAIQQALELRWRRGGHVSRAHQALRALDEEVGALAPHLWSDGDRDWLDLHPPIERLDCAPQSAATGVLR